MFILGLAIVFFALLSSADPSVHVQPLYLRVWLYAYMHVNSVAQVNLLACIVQEGVNELVEQLRVAVVVPPPLEAAFRLVPRSAFLVSHAVRPPKLVAPPAVLSCS